MSSIPRHDFIEGIVAKQNSVDCPAVMGAAHPNAEIVVLAGIEMFVGGKVAEKGDKDTQDQQGKD